MNKNGSMDNWNDGLLTLTPANEQLWSAAGPHQSIFSESC